MINGGRPDLPSECLPDYRTLLVASWAQQPEARPGFGALVTELRTLEEKLPFYTECSKLIICFDKLIKETHDQLSVLNSIDVTLKRAVLTSKLFLEEIETTPESFFKKSALKPIVTLTNEVRTVSLASVEQILTYFSISSKSVKTADMRTMIEDIANGILTILQSKMIPKRHSRASLHLSNTSELAWMIERIQPPTARREKKSKKDYERPIRTLDSPKRKDSTRSLHQTPSSSSSDPKPVRRKESLRIEIGKCDNPLSKSTDSPKSQSRGESSDSESPKNRKSDVPAGGTKPTAPKKSTKPESVRSLKLTSLSRPQSPSTATPPPGLESISEQLAGQSSESPKAIEPSLSEPPKTSPRVKLSAHSLPSPRKTVVSPRSPRASVSSRSLSAKDDSKHIDKHKKDFHSLTNEKSRPKHGDASGIPPTIPTHQTHSDRWKSLPSGKRIFSQQEISSYISTAKENLASIIQLLADSKLQERDTPMNTYTALLHVTHQFRGTINILSVIHPGSEFNVVRQTRCYELVDDLVSFIVQFVQASVQLQHSKVESLHNVLVVFLKKTIASLHDLKFDSTDGFFKASSPVMIL